MLDGYPPDMIEYLVSGFISGFKIGFNGPDLSNKHTNHPSALKNSHVVDTMLDKEISLKRIAGPFQHPPQKFFVCSPLACIEKKRVR